jgi:glycosyltransferase involved in cell wall biosynthesis
MTTPRNKTKLAVVKPAFETLDTWVSWCDGLYGALTQLATPFNVKIFGYCEHPAVIEKDGLQIHLSNNISSLKYWLGSFNPKIIMGWGSSFGKWEEIKEYNGNLPEKKVLLYGGGPPDKASANRSFDKVVVENESDAKYFDNVSVAFGTNTDVFKPMDLNKMFPSLYPAAFALWKRHDLWAKSMPAGSLAVGQVQEVEQECKDICVEEGHLVLPSMPMTSLPYFYNQTKGVCLTSEHMGGCQRAALEAMACNVPVLVTSDSKAAEMEGVWTCDPDEDSIRQAYISMILMFENGKYDLRKEFIVDKYDHFIYAEKLKEVLC